MPATKKRLLIYTDHPCRLSGLGRISRELGKRFGDTFTVGYAGWGAMDDPAYPNSFAISKTNGSPEERHEFIQIAESFIPDYVLMIGDPWNWGHIPEAKQYLKRSFPAMRFIMLLTIDGDPLMPEWIRNLVAADVLGITSEYGCRVVRELHDSLKPVLVPLGVDMGAFNDEKVSSFIPPNHHVRLSRKNAFVLLWVGQNTQRKDPGSFLNIFVELASAHENLYAVMISQWQTPMGIDIRRVAAHLSVPRDRFFFIETNGYQGPSDAHMATIYGSCQVILCTSVGEGNWMPGYEAQACGCIPMGTGHTALGETIGARGRLFRYANQIYGEYDILRHYCDRKAMVEGIRGMYQDWQDKKVNLEWQRKKCVAWAKEQTWEKCADGVRGLFEQSGEEKARPYIKDKIDLNRHKPVMVCPSYSTSCGIAAYTESLVTAMTDIGYEPIVTRTTDPGALAMLVKDVGSELVHFQHEHSFYGDGYSLFKVLEELRQNHIRTVVTMHSASPMHEYSERVARLADLILVHSENAARVIGAHGVKGTRIEVVPMGCFFEKLPANTSRIREALKIKEDAFVVGTYGYMRPDKGFDVVVSAVHQVNEKEPGCFALIYSSPHDIGNDDYDKTFLDAMENLVTEDEWMILRERKSKADIVRIMSMCDMIALPYVEGAAGGGISSAAKDMLLLEKPMVVTATNAFSDLPDDSVLRINQNDSASLASLIRRIRKEPERFEEMGKAGRKFCWANRWHVIAEKHIDLYRTLGGE